MQPNRVYSAVFVDFDNVYISLTNHYGQTVAGAFANNPTQWLEWMCERASSTNDFLDESKRVIRGRFNLWGRSSKARITHQPSPLQHCIVRKCFLNPSPFWRQRSAFIRAGFEVVDCPTLTQQGKSAADIRMALAIVDALEFSNPLIHDFIILSGDADFAPVLHRIRERGRHISIVAAGYIAQSYKALANISVPQAEFVQALTAEEEIEEKISRTSVGHRLYDANPDAVSSKYPHGSTFSDTSEGKVTISEKPIEVPRDESQLEKLDQFVKDTVAESREVILGRELVNKIKAQFDNQDWFGYSNWEELMQERLPILGLECIIQGTYFCIYDPVRHDRPLLPAINQIIRDLVEESYDPVRGGTIANRLKNEFNNNDWYGHTNFRSFIEERAEDLGFTYTALGTQDYIWDPERHHPPFS